MVSGSDLGAAVAAATASPLELTATPNPDAGESSGVSTLDPLLRTATSSLSGVYGRIGSSGGISGLAVGARREHAGAWLLAEAVRSLLAALVAVPGHPELGPFYLLRGLVKAIRRWYSLLLPRDRFFCYKWNYFWYTTNTCIWGKGGGEVLVILYAMVI